jgi:hypothetical protein
MSTPFDVINRCTLRQQHTLRQQQPQQQYPLRQQQQQISHNAPYKTSIAPYDSGSSSSTSASTSTSTSTTTTTSSSSSTPYDSSTCT